MPKPPHAMIAFVVAAVVATGAPLVQAAPPQPPSNVQAADHPSDSGDQVDVKWTLSRDDENAVSQYEITWAYAPESVPDAVAQAREQIEWLKELSAAEPDNIVLAGLLRDACQALKSIEAGEPQASMRVDHGVDNATVNNLESGFSYVFAVSAIGKDDGASAAATSSAISPRLQYFDMTRFWVAVFGLILCGSITGFILLARGGMPIRIRRIPAIEAVEEAVGRATEMGRPVLFIAGTQDMNDLMTVAGITALSKVAKTVAEYDAKLEVPTSRSLVMTAARETVKAAFLSAGRPDAYNENLIYYVTDEQFGFVAYLTGMMVRNKPATCFYMGAFFAESLILAETGNSIGAIQIAGTAEPAQLPFFVAACDYTLIGEEFFAASAYLSGEPDQLGSLRGQDVGKIVAALTIVVGCMIATIVSVKGKDSVLKPTLEYLTQTMLK